MNCNTYGDVMHTSILQFLLELVTGILKSLARSLNVVDAYADMAKSFAMIFVAIAWFVVGIAFRAIVVCQLDNALAVGPV